MGSQAGPRARRMAEQEVCECSVRVREFFCGHSARVPARDRHGHIGHGPLPRSPLEGSLLSLLSSSSPRATRASAPRRNSSNIPGRNGCRDFDITEIDITESDVTETDITENDVTESDITESDIT